MSSKRYPEEFKRDAVRQVTDRGYSVSQVANRLGVTTHSLYTWLKKYGPDAADHQAKADDQAEIRRLQKELKRVTEERDILKKAAAYFANLSEWGTPLCGSTAGIGLSAGFAPCWAYIPAAFMSGCNDPVNFCSGVIFCKETLMSIEMDEEIKRWTARRKAALVMEIIQGTTTVAEASRLHDLKPSEVETWVDDAKRGMENALKARPEDIREQYDRQLKELQSAYGEAMLELRARKKLESLLGKDES